MLWAQQDMSHTGCAFRAQVCFTPSCSAVVCDWFCTGKERQRPALLVLAKGAQEMAKAGVDNSVWNFPLWVST